MSTKLGDNAADKPLPGSLLAHNSSTGSVTFFASTNLISCLCPSDIPAGTLLHVKFGVNRDIPNTSTLTGWLLDLGYYANSDGSGAWTSIRVNDCNYFQQGAVSTTPKPGRQAFADILSENLPAHKRLWTRANASHSNVSVDHPWIEVWAAPAATP